MRRILGGLAIFGFATFALAQTPAEAKKEAPKTEAPKKEEPKKEEPKKAEPTAPAATSELFPLKAGAKWKYKLGDAQDVEIRVESVKDGEATLGTYVQTRAVAKETVKVQADGVYRTKINDSPITPPVKILALPAAKDGNWTIDSKIQEQPLKGKYTIKDTKEKIKTKDGKEYETVVVDAPELDVAGTKTSVKAWYSAGKGMVKLSYTINNYEATIELVEYIEGK
jgi:hypothetical protein